MKYTVTANDIDIVSKEPGRLSKVESERVAHLLADKLNNAIQLDPGVTLEFLICHNPEESSAA